MIKKAIKTNALRLVFSDKANIIFYIVNTRYEIIKVLNIICR